MICPVCQRDMIVIEYHNIELDHCTNCKGVWFDSGELGLLLRSHHMEDAVVFLESALGAPEAATDERKRKCPICRRRMKKTGIGEQHPVLIDMCRTGHGLWFDGGEVSQLVRHLAEEHRLTSPGEGVISYLEEVFGTAEKPQ
jgi:Zn-finger nucleic acid-binding protein